MKRLVYGSKFPSQGTAQSGDSRKGIYTFGKGKEYEFRPGWFAKFSTGKVTYNASNNNVQTYCNIFVIHKETPKHFKEFFGYTPEETEDLMNYLINASEDELKDEIPDSGY